MLSKRTTGCLFVFKLVVVAVNIQSCWLSNLNIKILAQPTDKHFHANLSANTPLLNSEKSHKLLKAAYDKVYMCEAK